MLMQPKYIDEVFNLFDRRYVADIRWALAAKA